MATNDPFARQIGRPAQPTPKSPHETEVDYRLTALEARIAQLESRLAQLLDEKQARKSE